MKLSVVLNRKDSFDLERRKGVETNGVDFSVPEYLLPNQKDILLTPLFAMNNKNRVRAKTHILHLIVSQCFSFQPSQCLKVLSYSGWNPPNGSRKLHGLFDTREMIWD